MTDKKKSAKVEEDETTLKIPNLYKRKCEYNGITVNKIIKDKVEVAIEEGKLQSVSPLFNLVPSLGGARSHPDQGLHGNPQRSELPTPQKNTALESKHRRLGSEVYL